MRFPRFDLLPGSYSIHTEVTGFGRARIFDHLQDAMKFEVVPGDSEEAEGVVTFRPEWTIAPIARRV